MRLPLIKGRFLRRIRGLTRPAGPPTTSAGKSLDRNLRDAIDWHTRNRERRKRLGLE
jgi:hypothetical protein